MIDDVYLESEFKRARGVVRNAGGDMGGINQYVWLDRVGTEDCMQGWSGGKCTGLRL